VIAQKMRGRCIGRAIVESEKADICALEWVRHLGVLTEIWDGMEDFDLSSLEPAESRLLTQHAGRLAFELGYAWGSSIHARYGHSIENWAISKTGPCRIDSRSISSNRGKWLRTILTSSKPSEFLGW